MNMIKKVKTSNLNDMEEVLNEYVREGYNVDKLLDEFNMFRKEKKQILIKRFFDNRHYKFLEVITETKDKVFMVDYLVNRNLLMYAYEFLSKICDPKSFVKADYINKILKVIKTAAIIENFGTYFKDEILELKYDCYELLSIKSKLSDEDIKLIYKKSFNSFHHKIFDEYLSHNEQKEYTKLFVNENSDSYYIAIFLIKRRAYDKEDFDKLVLLIGAFAPADIIYDVLMNEKLNNSQIKMLEQSLYDTLDIEYIAYYTFYRNKKEFRRLFGNALLFLGFVEMYQDRFKNKGILKKIIEEIESKKANYVDSVISKVTTSYQIRPKNNVNPNK